MGNRKIVLLLVQYISHIKSSTEVDINVGKYRIISWKISFV